MWLFLFLLAFQEEFYYLDGVEFVLNNETIMRTAEPVKEDRLYYSWREGGTPILVEKQNVRSLTYFSMRVRGRKPYANYPTATKRRLTGLPVHFENDGTFFLKVRHVNERGRSTEGMRTDNRVGLLYRDPGLTGEIPGMVAVFEKLSEKTTVEFRFYSLDGRQLFKHFFAVAELSKDQLKKAAKSKRFPYRFDIPSSLNLERVGLVEILNVRMKASER